MAHVSREHLAGQALDPADELSAADLDHLAGCPDCRTELEALRHVAELGRHPGTSRVPLAPPEEVWDRIAAELAADEAGAAAPRHAAGTTAVVDPSAPSDRPLTEPPTQPATRPSGLPSGRSPARPDDAGRRSRRGLVLLAAAVGLVVGVAGTLGIARALRPTPLLPDAGPPVEVLATTTLTALPGKSGSGSAELLRTATTTELRVSVDASQQTDRFHELWLINTDGKRMYALGTLPTSGSAVYPLPPALATQLQGYTIVDVSIEPYDGNAQHSHNSLVRGTLP